MKEPSTEFLIHLAKALEEAEHKNVAEGMASGMLWAMYPEWFEAFAKAQRLKKQRMVKNG